MSIELWCLFLAMALGLVHLSAASFAFKAQVGNRYSVGSREEGLAPTGLAGRLDRAQRNFLETFAIFAAAVLMVEMLNEGGWLSAWGAGIYLAGRVLFLPLYAAGLPWVRTFSWNAATLGLVMVMIEAAI
ncbi:MAG: MAPEG family protein [Phenylobacterium sp.]|uniref:MAPEG family protein n=1 Tax=Phenylobacterium sp. TaxID=1871053 RepID=UPI00391DEB80